MTAQRHNVMRQKSEHVVRFVAVVLTVWALWTVVRGYRGIWLSLQCLVTCPGVDLEYIWFVMLSFTWFCILPATAFVSAYGYSSSGLGTEVSSDYLLYFVPGTPVRGPKVCRSEL